MTCTGKTYTLTGADGKPYQSSRKESGGARGTKIYGCLDCPAALRAIARGGYVKRRVFFADEATRSPLDTAPAEPAARTATRHGQAARAKDAKRPSPRRCCRPSRGTRSTSKEHPLTQN